LTVEGLQVADPADHRASLLKLLADLDELGAPTAYSLGGVSEVALFPA
jgi:hypothetical protein